MRSRVVVFVLCLLGLGAAGVRADDPAFVEVDYAALERRIAREPVYGDRPLYALLVLDPAGRFRVWAAFDRSTPGAPFYDVLWLDANGDGDLTQAGERLDAVTRGPRVATFDLDRLAVPGTALVHRGLRFTLVLQGDDPSLCFSMDWDGRTHVSGGTAPVGSGGYTRLARSPAEAPVLRPTPLGPLSFGLFTAPVLVPGKDAEIRLLAGNPGSGKDTFSWIAPPEAFADDEEVAGTLEWRDGQGKELKLRLAFTHHC